MAPPPTSISIIGITNSPSTVASLGGSRSTTPTSLEILSKQHQISPTLIYQPEVTSKPSSPPHLEPSEKSSSLPVVVVPELVIPAEAQVNRSISQWWQRVQMSTMYIPPYKERLYTNSCK